MSFLSTIEVESQSVEFISVIEAWHVCASAVHYYTDDLLPYVPFRATGDVLKVVHYR